MEYRATVVLPQTMAGRIVAGISGRSSNVFTWIYTPQLDEIRSHYLLTRR